MLFRLRLQLHPIGRKRNGITQSRVGYGARESGGGENRRSQNRGLHYFSSLNSVFFSFLLLSRPERTLSTRALTSGGNSSNSFLRFSSASFFKSSGDAAL